MLIPKVSVIVPCWGVERYLDRCVDSLVSQTLRDIEIILVDDLSPDRVPEMCDEWARKDPRVRVIHKPRNEGLGMACNTGIEAATGEYVAFCDSDDWVEHNMYEDMYSSALANDADIVFSGLRRINDAGICRCFPHYSSVETVLKGAALDALASDIIASIPSDSVERHLQMSAKTVLYRRKMLSVNDIRFESERDIISEDLVFNLDCLAESECACVLPSFFYNYYQNGQSITANTRTDRFDQYLKLRHELRSRYPSRSNDQDYMERVDRMFIGYCRAYIVMLIKDRSFDANVRKSLVTKVCNNGVWSEISGRYPVHEMPLKHKIFYKAMISNRFYILSLLSVV